MSERDEFEQQGLARALEVARSGTRSPVSDGDAKLLAFLLRDGECDARIAVPSIEVRYSWLRKRKPSTYFGFLAPGLISQLMNLGSVKSIADAAEFSVGPGIAGIAESDDYKFSFARKWISVCCSSDEIVIRVRDQREDLKLPLRDEFASTAP